MRMQWVICNAAGTWDGESFVSNPEYPKKYLYRGTALNVARILEVKFDTICKVLPYTRFYISKKFPNVGV